MRKLAAALTAGALLTAAGTAGANHSKHYQGIVRSVDPQTETVTFQDGETFRAAEGVEVDGLDPGTQVIFWYHTYGGQKTVVSYEYAGGTGESSPESILPAAGQ